MANRAEVGLSATRRKGKHEAHRRTDCQHKCQQPAKKAHAAGGGEYFGKSFHGRGFAVLHTIPGAGKTFVLPLF
jgi:hypothetical protein